MSHPEPQFESAQLFTAGSYGVDIVNAGDGLRSAPRQGWCQLSVIREAVISAITFGDDVSGGSKLVGQTLKTGIYLWARIISIEISGGVIELRRGRFNPEGEVIPTDRIAIPITVEVRVDDGLTVISWTTPPFGPDDEYEIYRDGVLIQTVPSGARSYVDGMAVPGQTYSYQVFLVT